MNSIKYFLILCFLLFTSIGIAQREVLHGTVTNAKDVEGIHVMNTSSRYNSVTNEYGNFSINVSRQDTLIFSSVTYVAKKVVITAEIYEKGVLTVKLEEIINELDPVVLGPNLTGNIETDLKNIKTEKDLNFDDVGIEGFKGKGEEKIVPVAMAFFPLNVNLEAVYKYWSGYYRKLKIKRTWETQNNSISMIIYHYSIEFFDEAYDIPENRVYDFILFCIETSTLQHDFKNENFAGVLDVFGTKSVEYLARLTENEE